MKLQQQPLPLTGGGQTSPGYSTVFLKAPKERPKDRAFVPPKSPAVTKRALDWIMRRHKEGPQFWRAKRGWAQDDCIAARVLPESGQRRSSVRMANS